MSKIISALLRSCAYRPTEKIKAHPAWAFSFPDPAQHRAASGVLRFWELMRPILRLPPRPTSYSTQFDLDENPINESGSWKRGTDIGFYQAPRSLGGICYAQGTNAAYDDSIAHLINHGIPVNHRVGVIVSRTGGYTPPDSHEIGLYLRMVIGMGTGGNKVRGYECLFPFTGAGSFQIIRWNGTVNDNLANFTSVSGSGSPGTINDGDLIEAQIVGSTIKCYHNGNLFRTSTDATWSDGNPGLGFFIRPGGTPSSFCAKSFFAQAAV